MPFIGNQPALSYTSFVKQDFTTSATTSYTLSQPVANENEIALFINFVRQEPTTAYTASGTSLTLTSATSASDDMYAIFLGKAVQTVNPPAGSVSLDKIDSTAKSFLTRNYRNIIINGDMSIAQRGTSTVSITASGYYTADRFRTVASSFGAWTQSQDTDVPSGQGFSTSLKLDCTTADASPSASDVFFIQQRIEGQILQYLKKGTANAESLTLSFWVKSNKTGTYILELYDADNSRQISKSYTINSASTWEKKTLTFAGDTTGVFDNDNSASLDVNFWLGAGSTYTSGTLNTSWGARVDANRVVGQVNLADSTSNDFWITGVQLEAGTTASDFEFLPVDVNLQRCQRYYYRITGSPAGSAAFNTIGSGTAILTTRARVVMHHPVTLRTNPSISYTGTLYFTTGASQQTATSFDTSWGGLTSGMMDWNTTSSFTQGDGLVGFVNNTAGTFVEVSSEL